MKPQGKPVKKYVRRYSKEIQRKGQRKKISLGKEWEIFEKRKQKKAQKRARTRIRRTYITILNPIDNPP